MSAGVIYTRKMYLLTQPRSDNAIELEFLFVNLQMQVSCLGLIEKSLESVTNSSITSACILELTRQDTLLKSFPTTFMCVFE